MRIIDLNHGPKVSIVIPVYNGSNYLTDAIDSALAQTYKNIEVIVINDGSNDNGATEKIAKSYGNKIRYYKKENGGVATALNLGIEKMTGEYFSWLSHDDMYHKAKIAEQVKYLDSLSNKNTVIACNAKVLFPNGVKKDEFIDKKTFEYIDIFLATSAVVGLNGCSLLIPKKAFEVCGVFDGSLPVTQDYDLWFRIAKKYPFRLIEKKLIISRRHDGQDSVQKQKICFEAGEELHHRFLSEISEDRFNSFFQSSASVIEEYLSNYRTYRENGFIRTSTMMLSALLNYYRINDKEKYNELFSIEIGNIISKGRALENNSSRKRIVIYCNVWQKGGIERVLSVLIPHLEKKYDCILISSDSLDINNGFNLPETITKISIRGKDAIKSILGIVCSMNVDLFIGNPNYNVKFLDIYEHLKNFGIKSVAYNHGYYFLPYLYGGYLYPVALKIKDAYKNADSVVWLTKIAKDIYGIDADNGFQIPNPISPGTETSAKTNLSKRLITVGRFNDEVKQLHKTLVLFKELLRRDSSLMLDVVGPVDEEMVLKDENIKLKDFLNKLDIPQRNINFVGEVADVNKYYQEASMLIMTSRCEGFGMVFLEAMSKGLPCASFYYLGIEEIIQNGKNGITVASDNYVEMADKILNIIKNRTNYLQMSRNAAASVKKFSSSNYTGLWDDLIAKILSGNSLVQQKRIISPEEYEKIILEYEKCIKEVVQAYITDIDEYKQANIEKPSKLRTLKFRLLVSLKNDGYFTTLEKAARKISNKIKAKTKN